MSIRQSDPTPSEQSPSGISEIAEKPNASEGNAEGSGNAVGVLLLLALAAFVITDAISGQRAAGIAFWIVALGLPALYVVVSALGTAWRGNRNDELLAVAVLAVEMAQRRDTADTFGTDERSEQPSVRQTRDVND